MTETQTKLRYLLVLWALFLVLIPFYFFGRTPVAASRTTATGKLQQVAKVEGGVPQIADFLALTLMALVVVHFGLRVQRRFLPVLYAVCGFFAYVVLVNGSWTFMAAGVGFALLKNCIYYGYNLCLFTTALILYTHFGDDFLRATLYGVIVSVLLQTLLSPIALVDETFRQSLFFNMPNQLGYYAVLTACLFYVGSRYFSLPAIWSLLIYPASIYLAYLSLSKAALFSLGLVFALALLKRPLTLIFVGLILAAGVMSAQFLPEVGDKLEKRFAGKESDDSWAKRGYDRIYYYPQYLVLGAGEGANHRFYSEHAGELHSSLGTILFCYGIPGLILFGLAIYYICRGKPFADVLALAPIFMFGMAHHGLRFTMFWVALAFLCCRPNVEAADENLAIEPRLKMT